MECPRICHAVRRHAGRMKIKVSLDHRQLDGRIVIEAPRGASQSSVGMAWHGLLARPAEEVLFVLQFQGATGTEAPSHGCRAARLLCVFV